MKSIRPFAPRRGSSVPDMAGMLLAIDPGIHTGWALFSPSCFLVACGTGKPPTAGVVELVIEVPQIYRNGKARPNDLITLAFMAGRYVGNFGGKTQYLWPHEWKGTLPKKVCENRIRRKLVRPAELYPLIACQEVVPEGQMNNVWDAIGLGMHAWRGGIG